MVTGVIPIRANAQNRVVLCSEVMGEVPSTNGAVGSVVGQNFLTREERS